MQGKFSVNGHGAATYSIGIAVPPGIGGLEPILSLEYNSQSKSGPLGMGWSYGGLQSISRCGQSKLLEGDDFTPGIHFTNDDRYCLNGERLITDGTYGANGTTYVTETDKWVKVQSVGTCGNGPCAFYVTDAQGTKHGFGSGSTNSPFNAIGRDERLHFPLTSTEDRNGNVIIYDYQRLADGETLLKGIRYNHRWDLGNISQREVVFNYATRPDISKHYMDGQLYKSTQRLTSITTFAAAQLIQSYQLSYDTSPTTNRSRMTSIQRCGTNDCLPATVFDYKDSASSALAHTFNNAIGGWSDVGSSLQHQYIPFDYDLDGRTDLIQIYKKTENDDAYSTVWLKGDTGFEQGPVSYMGGWTGPGSSDQRRYLAMDHDRDGRTDIIEVYKGGNGSTKSHVWRNSGSGFESGSISTIGGWADIGSADQRRYLVFDANKDGWTDIIEIWKSGSDTTSAKAWLNQQGNGFENHVGSHPIGGWTDVGSAKSRRYLTVDVNGDGMTDILEIYYAGNNETRVSSWLSNGAGFTGGSNNTLGDWVDLGAANGHQFYPMDVNGDGLPDLVKTFQGNGDDTGASIFWNTGTQFVKNSVDSSLGSWKNTDGSDPHAHRYLPMDVNGDGKADFVKLYNGTSTQTHAEMWYGSNDGFIQGARLYIGGWSNTNGANARRYLPMDTNGDGVAEIVELYNKGGGYTGATNWQFNRQADQDQIIAITDG
ncbi:hypothetical protein I8J31_20625, partial [Marinomonas sp. C1424]|nr:hypothetical protein [Marinomonas transparens]